MPLFVVLQNRKEPVCIQKMYAGFFCTLLAYAKKFIAKKAERLQL